MAQAASKRSTGGSAPRAKRPRSSSSQRLPFKTWELWALAAILLLAVFLRWSYLQELRAAPGFEHPLVDAGFNDYWGRALASGDWTPPPQAMGRDPQIRTRAYLRPPGYPVFLAAVYSLTGGSYLGARVFQMGLGLASCVLAFLLGRSLFGRGVGLVFAGLVGVYWIFIYYEGELHAPVLLVFLVLVLLHALRLLALRPRARRAALAGALVGLMALVRPNVLLVAPVLALWLWWIAGRRPAGRTPLRLVVSFLAGLAALVCPATVRNLVAADDLVLVSAAAGVNLYIGNNPLADGTFLGGSEVLGGFGNAWEYPSVVARLESELEKSLKYSQVSAHFASLARSFIAEQPGTALRLTARKALLLFGPHEISHDKEVQLERRASGVLRRIPIGFPFALSTALVGIAALAWDRRRRNAREPGPGNGNVTVELSVAALAFLLVYAASFLPFFVTALYRVPMVPPLLLFGAYAIGSGAEKLRRRPAAATVLLTAWAVVFLAVRTPFVDYEPQAGKWHYDRGAGWWSGGEAERALEEFRSAIAATPANYLAHNGMGAVLLDQGRIDEAIEQFERATEVNPGYAPSQLNLGIARAQANRLEGSESAYRDFLDLVPDHVDALCDLGIVLERQGRIDEAIEQYAATLRVEAVHQRAANNLAWILATHPRDDLRDGLRAVELAERATELSGGNDPQVLDTLAAAYAEADRVAEAVATAERALSLARSAAEAREYGRRLELFRGGKAYRSGSEQ